MVGTLEVEGKNRGPRVRSLHLLGAGELSYKPLNLVPSWGCRFRGETWHLFHFRLPRCLISFLHWRGTPDPK